MTNLIPTPPSLPVDESKFLAVVHPYPLNANLELPEDQCALALWLACCAGKDALRAIFYKPSSAEMVVIAVDREFDRFPELLGLHAWSEFLMEPDEEQVDQSSTVFYSTFNTSRLVNTGWKQVDIEEHWFQGWTAKTSVFRYPYPKSSHCNSPSSSEANSGAPVCSLLPNRSLTAPSPPPGNKEDKPVYSRVITLADYEDPDFDYDPWDSLTGGQTLAGSAVNLWEGYNAPQLEPQTKVKKRGQWRCPQHGSRCSPDTCKEYACFERESQKARDKPKGGRKKAEAMGEGMSEGRAHLPVPRLCRDASSGNSTSSTLASSDSESDKSNKQASSIALRPDQKDRLIPCDTGVTETQPNIGFPLLAWDSDVGLYEVHEDDTDEDGASVVRSRTTNTSSAALRSNWASSPEIARSSERSKNPVPSGIPWSSADGRSNWPSFSGNSRPSMADTQWGDPIAKEDSRIVGWRETNSERGQKISKNARKRRNKARSAQAQTQAQDQAAQARLLEAALDVELRPSGPGSSWGNPNEAW